VSDDRSAATILTSGVGLGLYIPALLIERKLRRQGIAAEVEVLEGYFTPAYQQAHLAHRDAHHASFALAQLAHRMARDVEHCLEAERVEGLLARWAQQRRHRFVLWAGFWLPIIERYRRMIGLAHIDVDHCRIDAVVSASFKVHPELDALGREVWLWNWAERRIVHEIGVTGEPPVPYAARDDRLVVHGGGWGIGTYRATVPELARTPYALDVVVHDLSESAGQRASDRAFMLDPSWRTWHGAAVSEPTFPPMRELRDREVVGNLHSGDHHAMHDVIRASKAIVSKPGGCTLIDSLAAATPLVLLEPYGYAEERNARLWEHLGFGIPYAAWRETGFDMAPLAQLHENIIARARGIDYPGACAGRLVEADA